MKEAGAVGITLFILIGQLFVFGHGVAAQANACRVGQVLGPGAFCAVEIPGINLGTNRFEVRSDGQGCYGGSICAGSSLNLNGFRASKITGTTRWRIDGVPGGGINRPPQPSGAIPSQTLSIGGAPASVDVARYFTDPDADVLTYSASSNRTGIVTARAAGSTVTLTPLAAGSATVTVTARDPDGASATQSVAVTVTSAADGGDDRAALETLYDATGGPNWTNSTNWLSRAPLSTWYGVETDSNGRVTELDLFDNQLMGSIPAELGDLANLELLNLGGNRLTGTIPAGLGDLVNLGALMLGGNQLTGSIPPELGRLTNLYWLFLNINQLAGPIPPELGRLLNLEELLLRHNQLTGSIPPELGNLTSLRTLWLGDNPFDPGPIPATLGRLAGLEELYFGNMQLTGSIPAWLGTLTSLRDLYLYGNQLTGAIPSALGDLADLRILGVSDNRGLTGPLPRTLLQLALTSLYIADTQVCVHTDAAFQTWLAAIDQFTPSGLTCDDAVLPPSGVFTDPTLIPGLTLLRAVHVTELREAVNAFRAGCGLGALTWSDPQIVPGVTPVKAAHVTELRTALAEAYQACGRTAPLWTDPQIIPGTPVKALHFMELRAAAVPNRAPLSEGTVPAQTLMAGGSAKSVEVMPYFRDPDGDPLTYAAVSGDTGIVTARVSGSIITVAPVAAGTATVTITARDPDGLSATQAMAVSVETSTSEVYTPLDGLRVHPGGAVEFVAGNISQYAGSGCIRISGSTINGVTYIVHYFKWQRRDEPSGPWVDIPGTESDGLCAHTLSRPGEYRVVGELTIGGSRGMYSSENTVTVN